MDKKRYDFVDIFSKQPFFTGSSPEAEAEELDLTKLSPSLGLLITGGAPERSPMEQITKNEIYIPSKNCSCKFTDWPTKDDGLQAVGSTFIMSYSLFIYN